MKVAVIGSRSLTIIHNLQQFLPKETTEIVSGGAVGIDQCAREYAMQNKIKYTEFLPKEVLIKSGCAREREIFSADCTKNLSAC